MQVLYEDPDEEDRESKVTTDLNSTTIKTVGHQRIQEPIIEKHIEKSVSNPDDGFSIKYMEPSRSTTVIIFYIFLKIFICMFL